MTLPRCAIRNLQVQLHQDTASAALYLINGATCKNVSVQEKRRQGMAGICMCDRMQVAEALSRTKDMAVEAHARDELGIDLEDLDEKTNPWQVGFTIVPPPLCCRSCSEISAPRPRMQS